MRDEPHPNPSDDRIRGLAKKIAEYLFTNGCGDVADRLVMQLNTVGEEPRLSGGWSLVAATDRIEELLRGELDNAIVFREPNAKA